MTSPEAQGAHQLLGWMGHLSDRAREQLAGRSLRTIYPAPEDAAGWQQVVDAFDQPAAAWDVRILVGTR